MLQYLRNAGHLDDSDPSGSSVPVQPPADEVARTTLASIEAPMQRLLAQAPPVVPAPTPPTAPSASAPATATTGKPHLKFPDPPMFEGDPVKLDGWLTQTQMYLKAYDVDLASSRAADVATMFLRGKAQDWWTGQFHLISAGITPGFSTWKDFVTALTEAFRPVELHRKYIEQMLGIAQGKQDMRTYIASFNALRAKIPNAFPEQTLTHLFLQGCRQDLQRNISLQYPKSLAEYFQHAITLSDLPGQSKPPTGGNKGLGPAQPASQKNSTVCAHCHKPGHTQERCFQLHPDLRKSHPDKKKTQH